MGDLSRVDRTKTPFVAAVVHAPWYNSYDAHRDDYASVAMREAMEVSVLVFVFVFE